MVMQQPDRKVAVGAGVGGLTAVIAWTVGVTTGVTVPAEVAVAASTFLTFLTQYLVRN